MAVRSRDSVRGDMSVRIRGPKLNTGKRLVHSLSNSAHNMPRAQPPVCQLETWLALRRRTTNHTSATNRTTTIGKAISSTLWVAAATS